MPLRKPAGDFPDERSCSARSVGLHHLRSGDSAAGLAARLAPHFLFIRIGPRAEAGRLVEVFFGEQAEAGDPKFIAKIAQTKLWIQTRRASLTCRFDGQPTGSASFDVASDRSTAVVGRCEYGVLARPNQTPFLLRYYPKAVAGNPDEVNRLTPRRELPFEIQATFEVNGQDKHKSASGRVRLVAAHATASQRRTPSSQPLILI